jgi:Tol biopolymer transport system component
MKSWLLLLPCVVTACQTTPPAAPHPPDGACAVALPLLAKQHTPNATRLYLASLALRDGKVEIGAPALATSKRGYVHQPAFSPEGNGLYFTWRPDGSQADIWFRDLATGAERPVTCSSVEEYAAAPRGDGLTVVRVEPDLRRDLVSLGPDGRERQILFPSLTTVGAQVWIDDTTAVLFVTGTTPDGASSLVLADQRTGTLAKLVENVGAAMAVIPGTRDISFVDLSDDGHAKLMRLDVGTHATTLLLPLPDGVDQVAWLPDGSVLAGVGTRIVRASPTSPEWQDVAELASAIAGPIMRVVVSSDHRRIALVVRLTS